MENQQSLDQQLIDIIIENRDRVALAVSRLIRQGASVNAVNANDQNRLCAMYYAINNENINVISELLNGIDFRYMQRTPYNLFTLYIKKLLEPSGSGIYNDPAYKAIMRKFREQGVFIHVQNSDGETPLDIICRRGHLNGHMYEDNDNEISVPMQYQAFKDLAFMFERSGDSEEFEYTGRHPLDILEDYKDIADEADNELISEAITYFIRHRNFINIDGRFYELSPESSDWEPSWSSESEPSIADLTSSERRRRANIAQTIRERDAANAANAAAAYANAQAQSTSYEECMLCYEPLNNIDGPGPDAKCHANCNDVVIAHPKKDENDEDEPYHKFHRGCILNWCAAERVNVLEQMGIRHGPDEAYMVEMRKQCPLCNAQINCPDLVTKERVEFEPSPISSEGFGKTKGKKQKTRRRKINVRGTKRRKLKVQGKTKRKSTLRKRKIA